MIEPPAAPWLLRVRRLLGSLRGSAVVVAVSGGGDSVGLLRVMHALGPGADLRLSVAHLDHGARGEESRADAEFVEELASSLGLPFDLGQWRATRPGHFEADARRARYDWLAGVARGRGASAVAVGQTLDDQAETILHRIVRGTGVRGLSGMAPRRRLVPGVALVRPLLGTTRREVRDHLAALGQGFREDASNRDTSRTRARIRLGLLPDLARDYNPAVAEALVRLGRLASGSTRALEKLAGRRARSLVIEAQPDRVTLDRAGLARLGPFERAEVLRRVWREAGWPEGGMDSRRWRRLAALEYRRLDVGLGVEADLGDDRLVLHRSSGPPEPPPRDPVELPVPGAVEWGGGRIVAGLGLVADSGALLGLPLPPGEGWGEGHGQWCPDPRISGPAGGANAPHPGPLPKGEGGRQARELVFGQSCAGSNVFWDEVVDLDRLVLPLTVRQPAPGDRFGPLGMAEGRQSLGDFFRGRGVGLAARGAVPIVSDGEGIIWVAGHRIAHRVRRTAATRRVLGLRWEGEDCQER